MQRRVSRVGLLIASMLAAIALIAVIVIGASFALSQATRSASGSRAPGLLSQADAINSVRLFTGSPSLQLQGDLVTNDDSTTVVFMLQTPGLGAMADEFRVDAQTGEILEASFRSRLAISTPAGPSLGVEDAATVAGQFAESHFGGFTGLTMIERSQRGSEPFYTLKWVQVDNETRAELPTSVTVTVSGRNGEVVRYLAQREPVSVDTHPELTPSDAINASTARLSTSRTWSSATVATVRLQVIYDSDNEQRLVWSLTYSPPQQSLASGEYLRVLVDARTGELIEGVG